MTATDLTAELAGPDVDERHTRGEEIRGAYTVARRLGRGHPVEVLAAMRAGNLGALDDADTATVLLGVIAILERRVDALLAQKPEGHR